MRIRVSAILVALILTMVAGGAQQTPTPPAQPSSIDTPVFRANVDAVELDAFVVDAQGNPVTDLTVEDFEIIEDGRPQPITSFAVVDIPIERIGAPAPTLIPDVRSNERPEGRIYLFAVDEISPSLVANLRLRLRQFVVDHFGENDTAAIVYVGRGRSTDGQDFTSDRNLLLKSIDRLSGGFGASDIEQAAVQNAPEGSAAASIREANAAQTAGGAPAIGGEVAVTAAQALAQLEQQQQQAQQAQLNGSGSLLNSEAEYLLRQRMQSLRSLVEYMANIGGRRKSIIYATTGLGTSVYEALDYNGGVRSLAIEDLHAAITAATRGNVTIYPIDPAGLTLARDITGQVSANVDPLTEVSQTRIGRMQDLRGLAEATGGFAIIDTSNFGDAFSRVVRENSTYYVLGFSTATDRTDGRYHSVQIRVKRPGLQVRSRGGYLAPLYRKTPIITRASTLAPAVVDALQSPISVSGVPMRMFAAAYKGPDKLARIAVAVEFGVDGLNLVERQGRLVGDLALALRPTTAEGKLIEGQRHEMVLAFKPGTFALTQSRGVRVLTEMALAPGRYQLRAAGGPAVGRAGSVTYDLEIPNFSKDPLTLSGITMTSSTASKTVTVWPRARPLDGILPGPFTVAREFNADETVTLYAEVYENGKHKAHTVDFKVELRSPAGQVVSRFNQQRSINANATSTLGFVAPVRLLNADPGAYSLWVEAVSSGSKTSVSREIPIRIR
ncbi:MAG TPA: VWA domain-containing protein [Vicinamibacterales bacterium]|nr:VWA domain-containing protein [Vicinamibacterales bacterium]